jgi:hypothetical protein
MHKILDYSFDTDKLAADYNSLLEQDTARDIINMYENIGLTYADNTGNLFEQASGSLKDKNKNWTEDSFDKIIPQLSGTYTYTVIEKLKTDFNIGRTRFMIMKDRTCLTWHRDATPRLHIPIITNIGCKMIWENFVCHMKPGMLHWVNTTEFHTALNASREDRLHLVCTLPMQEEN